MNNGKATDDLGAIAHRAMIDRGLQPDFPPEAIQQLNAIPGPASDRGAAFRDMRQLLWCSIDNDTSRDLDQLTVAENLSGGRAKVLVAIADVDSLVTVGTPLDRHAWTNTTSVYTPAVIFPMLPERLSTDLTSLGEGVDRLAVVVEMVVAADGSVAESDVYKAIVRNRAKLAYRGVAAWLDGQAAMPDRVVKVQGMDEQLKMQDQVAQVMRKVRFQHGALELETIEPETVISVGQVVELRVEGKNRAKELIEDFMIAANGVTARFLDQQGVPALRRIVRSPERWAGIQKVAAELGESLPSAPDSQALAAFLAKRRQADPLRFPDLSLTIVKLMGAGEYVVQAPGQESTGHFGLAVQDYTHSTAPNRRFPDLITQRLLKATLLGGRSPYSAAELGSLATHCTEREDAARRVERQMRKSAAAQFLSKRIGEAFDAIVTGVSDKGTWVRLLSPPAEGMLVSGQRGVEVGERINVQLVDLNVERGFIDFARAGVVGAKA
jgi:VacB/RNase II family 3'-5' exoribonuclease